MARAWRAQVLAECETNLAALQRAYASAGEAFPPEARPGGPFADFSGQLRGHCPRCNGCPGYELPRTAHEPRLLTLCAHCGCDAAAHELMRSRKDAADEKADDIMKSYRYD